MKLLSVDILMYKYRIIYADKETLELTLYHYLMHSRHSSWSFQEGRNNYRLASGCANRPDSFKRVIYCLRCKCPKHCR